METLTAKEIYEQIVKHLPPEERLQLIELVKEDLATRKLGVADKRNIMELHGLGADIWRGIDAQEYVDELRKEGEEH